MAIYSDLRIFLCRYIQPGVKLTAVYKCLCDETRRRILHLLAHRPLCVCHFQKILKAPQVKISKHLAYLREHALVETTREGAWIVYSLPAKPSPELKTNMQCLRDCCRESPLYRADLLRMAKALSGCGGPLADCCAVTTRITGRNPKCKATAL